MGLREDFRNALGAIATAAPEAVRTMCHGDAERGGVVQSASRDFADPVSESAPAEEARYIANAADFPTLDQGAAVELDGTLRVVVSLRQDPVGATFTVGLSAAFDKCPAAYRGTRREDGAARSIQHPLDILLLENGTADNYSDAFAPTFAEAYLAAIRADDWPETSAPDPSDTIEVAPGGHPLVLKVSTVTRHGGWYILKCRTKG
ncbi:MAG: hypothetical protein IIZ06_05425 [Kiritimatiellae bacterium]|nr:hypothetical protein [Kiritimatiellia bacterium]